MPPLKSKRFPSEKVNKSVFAALVEATKSREIHFLLRVVSHTRHNTAESGPLLKEKKKEKKKLPQVLFSV